MEDSDDASRSPKRARFTDDDEINVTFVPLNPEEGGSDETEDEDDFDEEDLDNPGLARLALGHEVATLKRLKLQKYKGERPVKRIL